MAWTDYSNTPANAWDSSIGTFTYDSSAYVGAEDGTLFDFVFVGENSIATTVNELANSYNVPGFDDGYQPEGVNNPIDGDLGGGSGGGSTRPTSGFLYPRGQG